MTNIHNLIFAAAICFTAAMTATFTPATAAAHVAVATASTEAADTTVAAPSGQALRGTDRPLERDASAVQYTGRALLFVPYAATRVITWPADSILSTVKCTGFENHIPDPRGSYLSGVANKRAAPG